MKEVIVVKTWNIKVGSKFWKLEYEIWRNGQLVQADVAESSHSRSPTTIRKYLKNGGATIEALQRFV